MGILTADLHLPVGSSLKAKRKELLRLKSALVRRFACAVAEVDHHDLWQRSRITVALVSRTAGDSDERLAEVSRFLHADEAFQVVGEDHQVIGVEDAVAGWAP